MLAEQAATSEPSAAMKAMDFKGQPQSHDNGRKADISGTFGIFGFGKNNLRQANGEGHVGGYTTRRYVFRPPAAASTKTDIEFIN